MIAAKPTRFRLPTGHIRRMGNGWQLLWKFRGKQSSTMLVATNSRTAEKEKDVTMCQVKASIHDDTYAQKYGGPRFSHETPQVTDIPIAEAWTAYLNTITRPDSGEATLKQYACQFRKFSKWIQDHHPEVVFVSQLQKSVAREFASHIRTDHSPNTFNKYVTTLHMIFGFLYDDLEGHGNPVAHGNPWDGIQKLSLKTTSRRIFTVQELKVIFEKATDELRTLCMIGFYTGQRLGDVCTMKWDEVDFTAKEWVHTTRKCGVVASTCLKDELISYLQPLSSSRCSSKYVCPEYAAMYLRDTAAVSHRIQRFFEEECGFKTQDSSQKRTVAVLSFHSFRHTYVTLAKKSGVDDVTIEKQVGWTTSQMIKTYNHVDKQHMAESMRKSPSLESLFSCAPTQELTIVNKTN